MDTRSASDVPDASAANEARHEVLSDSNAQTVRNYLKRLFQAEARFRGRWVWELVQNARDASSPLGVRIWLWLKPDRIIFGHDGLPFNYKNIAHLIYHGTTKYEPSESGANPIGQYGTGFLTTHLISKTLLVRGRLDDKKSFNFLLDRRGDSADELKAAMDASWGGFVASCSEANDDPKLIRTEYEYPLAANQFDGVNKDISDLIENVAYLLSFNKRIRRLYIDRGGPPLVIEKKDPEQLTESAQRVRIDERVGAAAPTSRYVAIILRDSISAAVELSKSGERWSAAAPKRVPRLYKAFPLVSTADFCLPVVINSESFDPPEDRDTLILHPDREGKNENMTLMEAACDLAAQMPVLATDLGWAGAPALARANPVRPWEWADSDWLRQTLTDRFIKPLRAAPILENDNYFVDPAGSLVPALDSRERCEELWDIAHQVKEYIDRLPMRHETWEWAETFASWADVLQEEVDDFNESLTLADVCTWVAKSATLAELQGQLREGTDAFAWLNQLFALIGATDCVNLLESEPIVPSQSGDLKKVKDLALDRGINDELKKIAESLGLAVYGTLVHPDVELGEFVQFDDRVESEVLSDVLQRFKERAKVVESAASDRQLTARERLAIKRATASADTGPKERDEGRKAFHSTAVQLFVWLVLHDHIEKLEELPAVSRATTSSEETTLLRLPLVADVNGDSDDIPLAPVGCWPEAARAVADLFPRRHVLADEYHAALPDSAAWEGLAAEGYVRVGPLFRTLRRGISFIPDEPLPASDDKKVRHVTKDPVEVSALAYFERDGTGLDAVRRSKSRAIELLLFLANYVLELEPDALKPATGECECGRQHRYYPCHWLLPMWDRKWVPLGDNKQAAATAESIAQLFEEEMEGLGELTAGRGKQLLEALGISMADLTLRAIAPDEETRISLIGSVSAIMRATGNDVEKVKLLANEINESPDLIDELEERRDRREMVRRNQSIGKQIENFLEEILTGSGVKVIPTGIGSDFEVTEDYLQEGQEVLLRLEGTRQSILVEVKATTGDVVRMTVAQARTAVDESERFALCVVQLANPDVSAEIVREQCRFIMDIGTLIEPIWNEYDRFEETKGELRTTIGDVGLDIAGNEVRFRVSAGAWAEGLAFGDAVSFILSTCGARKF
jgi:hypothetical protein